MTPSCAIRRLDHRDAGGWASLRMEALEAHPLTFGSSVPDDPSALVGQFIERLAPSEDAAIFGAFVGPSMIGIVGIRRNDGGKERHEALVWGMYVTTDARRCGAGAALLEQAIAQARAWPGVEQVYLAVSDAAPDAKRLYERTGFIAWGHEARALSWHGRDVGETHMVLDLRDSPETA